MHIKLILGGESLIEIILLLCVCIFRLDCCSFTTSIFVKIYMNYSSQQGCDEDLYVSLYVIDL
jgi:hypothetical protein